MVSSTGNNQAGQYSSKEQAFVCRLEEVGIADISIVGGKNASLQGGYLPSNPQ
jgi:hypothetical protein